MTLGPVFTGIVVRGVGFEPTKAYATGSLLKPDLKSSTTPLSERSCPFDLNPAPTGQDPIVVSGTPAFGSTRQYPFLKPI